MNNVDLRISVTLGATLPTMQYGNIKPEITISNIDPNGNVEEQIELAIAAIKKGFESIDNHLVEFVESSEAIQESGTKLLEKVDTLETKLEKMITYIRSNVKPLVDSQKG